MLQRNEILSDYLLLSPKFFDLTADNLQFLFDNLLLTHSFEDLTSSYRIFLSKSFVEPIRRNA